VTAGWAAVAQGATGILAGAATIADSLSLSTGTGSSGPPATASPAKGQSVHGNDLSTTKPAEGYSLRDRKTGEVLKYGETTLGKGRYTKQYLKDNNAEIIFEAKGTKAEMHKWQNDKILKYKQVNNGQRPPLNKSDW
jgi:hypothetical protein